MTARQKRFVEEYLLCGNSAEAARRAGYSVKTANRLGSRLLKNPEISAAIAERRIVMANEKILTATDLQEFLSSVIRGEVQDEQLMARLVGKGCSVIERHKYTAAVKDRLRAAELLGKIIGAFDKQEASDANIFISTLKNIWAHEDDGLSAQPEPKAKTFYPLG